MQRRLTRIDELCIGLDNGLRTLFAQAHATRRSPAAGMTEPTLSDTERRESAALMRVNHVGEVCAQALYQSQALWSRDSTHADQFRSAAADEWDHLAWTAERVHRLQSHTSYLNPLWWGGAFAIGSLAGLAGDRWSLGFVIETERQVEAHLASHLDRLPPADQPSRAIVEVMKAEEAEHAETASKAGGRALPAPVQQAMRLAAKVMTTVAHRF
jgi:3-demethoxyubiquinol 3-hydroxylase